MAITKNKYGKAPTGEDIYKFELDNGTGLSAHIINYGGIITNIYVPDKRGNRTDVVLGFDGIDGYLNNDGYLGAVIGRCANRIEDGVFELNGKTYRLNSNEGNNCLHGGISGFDKKVWNAETLDSDEPSLKLTLSSPDGDEGFPGNLDVTVTYTVTCENSLKIVYNAVCDEDTVVNLTNHSYFNPAGAGSGTIDDQTLVMNSSFYTPNSAECLPTGEILSVDKTPFDFRTEKRIGDGFKSGCEQIKMFGGYDHNFVIDGRGMRHAATARCKENGITVSVYTDLPAMQFYTANVLSSGIFKNGAACGPHSAFCLETQLFPNSMKYAHFPDPILKAGETYSAVTEYVFGAN